jgi:hypothetical protein
MTRMFNMFLVFTATLALSSSIFSSTQKKAQCSLLILLLHKDHPPCIIVMVSKDRVVETAARHLSIDACTLYNDVAQICSNIAVTSCPPSPPTTTTTPPPPAREDKACAKGEWSASSMSSRWRRMNCASESMGRMGGNGNDRRKTERE